MALSTAAIVAAAPLNLEAAEYLQLPDGAKLDLSQKCPVCGMVVGGKDGEGVTVTFKDGRVVGFRGTAAAVFKDGHVTGFEGARCLFIYNSVPEKYSISVADIAHQYVTDFVSKKMIDLPNAFLVLGSNVKGPMGYELIPFTNKEEAAEFASRNDGKWIVQLHEVARTAQQEGGKIGTAEKRTTPGGDQKKAAAPVIEPGKPGPPEPDAEKTTKRPERPRIEDTDRIVPYAGGSGHHGGGHHTH